MVAVETWESVAIASGVNDIENTAPAVKNGLAAHLAERPHRVKGCRRCPRVAWIPQAAQLIRNGSVSLLKENAYLARTEFHFTSKRAKSGAD